MAGLPPASWSVTTGWVANGVPPAPPLGCVEKDRPASPAAATVKDALVADDSPAAVAVSVYVPGALTEQPVNFAVPAAVFVGLQVRVAPDGPDALSVMAAVLPATVLPFSSTTATTGWTAMPPLAPATGWPREPQAGGRAGRDVEGGAGPGDLVVLGEGEQR